MMLIHQIFEGGMPLVPAEPFDEAFNSVASHGRSLQVSVVVVYRQAPPSPAFLALGHRVSPLPLIDMT